MSNYLGVNSAVACQSGTSAIHLSLVECGIKPGDMVFVPTLTFIAAVNPVRYQYAEPIFMDCDDSLCMDPIRLEEFCEEGYLLIDGELVHRKKKQRIKAIIVVHAFGNMANMCNIMKVARKYNLKVIEDATEALGTKYLTGRFVGKYAGTIGDYGAFSFNGNKIITTGGGGIVLSNNEETNKHLKYLSTQAKDDPDNYIHNEVGYNYRMTNVQAAIGVAQMESIEIFIEVKNSNYDSCLELFSKFDDVNLLPFRENVRSNKWFYSLLINTKGMNRSINEIIDVLKTKDISCRSIWGLIHEQRPYCDFIAYKINKAYFYFERVLNIPCSTNLTKKDIKYVASTIGNTIVSMKNN